jgi:hypothetical protein
MVASVITYKEIELIPTFLKNTIAAKVSETNIEVRSARVPIKGLGANNWGKYRENANRQKTKVGNTLSLDPIVVLPLFIV